MGTPYNLTGDYFLVKGARKSMCFYRVDFFFFQVFITKSIKINYDIIMYYLKYKKKKFKPWMVRVVRGFQ